VVTWSSSDATVAIIGNGVGSYGLATSSGQGTATITATSASVTSSTILTVGGPALVSIAISPGSASIPLGTSQQFTAMGTYTDGSVQDVTASVTWTSDFPAIAPVTAGGLVMGAAMGTANISASSGAVANSASVAVTAPLLLSISVSPGSASVAAGNSQQFAATGTYSNGSTQNLTSTAQWTSSATAVATVSSGGLATGVAQGTTTIKAKSGTITGSATLTVTPAVLTSISVTPSTASIAAGNSQQFTATGTYSNGSMQNLTSTVQWTSFAISVATVNAGGLATGIAEGATTIAASTGAFNGAAALTVTPAVLTSISITPGSASIAKGTSQQFTATGTYSDGSTQNLSSAVNWSSSLTTVATIGTSGLATGAAIGSATITATSGLISASASLSVGQPVLVSMAVTPANPSFALGTTQQLAATGTYSDGSTLDLSNSATWSTGDGSIATVNGQGLAAGVALGSSSVTASSGAITGSTILTVSPAVLVSIAVTPAIPTIPLGTTQQFTATGTYTDNSMQDITGTVQWSSDTPAVATISNAAGSQGVASSVVQGTATITARVGGVSGSTTLSVTSAALVSLALTPAAPALALGTTQQFTATGTFTDGSMQNLTSTATWSSDTVKTATINSTGLASSAGIGTATITATSGSVTGSTLLTVTAAVLVSIAIDPPATTIPLGMTQPFTATGTFTDGTVQDVTQSGHWSSTVATVATISNSAGTAGLATTLATGTTTIGISSGGVSAAVPLVVNPAVLVSIAISPQTPTIALGTSQQYTATGTYSDGNNQDVTSVVTWSSSDATVAIIGNGVGSYGLATSSGQGTATITATSASVT
ncbi:MAG: Ig-like domain-containing protein, partial [Candidatus Sulfotelmatobacter sp.]